MKLKNYPSISKYVLSLMIIIIFSISNVSCEIFNSQCSTSLISESNLSQPVTISIMSDTDKALPKEFEVKIEFDNDVFRKNSKIKYSEIISKNYKHKKDLSGNELTINCSLKAKKSPPAETHNQELFSLTFTSKKSISKTDAQFIISIHGDFETENFTPNIKIDENLYSVITPRITKLVPSCGSLNPEFDPLINEYSLSVPENTQNMDFESDCENNYSVSANRHKLNAPGKNTDIYLTVKGNKKGSKNVYHISVNRDKNIHNGQKSGSKQSHTRGKIKDLLPKNKRRSSKKKKNESESKFDISENDDSKEIKNDAPKFRNTVLTSSQPDENTVQKYAMAALALTLISIIVYLTLKRKKLDKNQNLLNKFFGK